MALVRFTAAFVRQPQPLTLVQKRIFTLACATQTNGTASLSPADYAQVFGGDKSTARKHLKNAGLAEVVVVTAQGAAYQLVAASDYQPQGDVLVVRLSAETLRALKPASRQGYIAYDLDAVKGFRSIYAWRLYEYLLTWQSAGKVSASLNTLREVLAAPESARTARQFMQYIVKPALAAIEASDLLVEMTPRKKGLRLVSLGFSLPGFSPPIQAHPLPATADEWAVVLKQALAAYRAHNTRDIDWISRPDPDPDRDMLGKSVRTVNRAWVRGQFKEMAKRRDPTLLRYAREGMSARDFDRIQAAFFHRLFGTG